MKRRTVVLFCVLFLMSTLSASARGGLVSGKERENRLYPSEAEALETAGILPTVCTPVSECYRKEDGERGFSEELLVDLQERVRTGGMAAAVEAYQDDALLIDVDTLLSLCPDYENLIAAQAKKQNVGISEKEILEGIERIYRLTMDGEMLLVKYRDLEVPYFCLKKTEEGYLASHVHFGDYQVSGNSWEHKGEAMLAEGDGYCLLEWAARDGEEVLSLYSFTLREDWRENIGETRDLFIKEIRYIKEIDVRAEPFFYYLNGKHPLTGAVRTYVEGNAYVFAAKLEEEDSIWGDEMPSALLAEEGDVYLPLADWYASFADYDNDGKAELFWREIKVEAGYEAYNKQIIKEGEEYRKEDLSLYGEEMPAARLWFVEFSGKTVTFEITKPYGEAYPLLAAYLVENDKKTPLLTCQLVYGRAVEIVDWIYGEGNNFQLRRTAPLVLGSEKETAQQAAFRRKLTAWIREAGRAFSVAPLQAETPFSEEFLEFIREGAVWCFSGGSFSSYAAPYEVYTERELEKFEEELSNHSWWYDVIYREEAQDGSVYYLVRDSADIEYGVNTLLLCRDNGEDFEEEPMTDFSCEEGSYCGVLSYEGQRYCVIVNTNEGGALWQMDLLPLGEAGEWEHYCISFYREEEAYETLSLTENAALDGYVKEEAEAICEATAPVYRGTSYEGRGGWGEVPPEIWRDIKNRDSSYSQYADWWRPRYDASYIPVDVDNDGEMEYASVWTAYGKKGSEWLEFSIYGWRDGMFTELTIDGEGLLWCYEDKNDGYGIVGELDQLWFEEIEGVTYLFTAEKLSLFDGFLVRARLIQDGSVQDAGAWLFRRTGAILQDIQKMGEYDSWLKA